MNIFTLDCSVALSWCFENELTEHAAKVLDMAEHMKCVVPNIWPLEICNVLCVAERNERITQEDSRAYLDLLTALRIEIDVGHTSIFNNKLFNLARRHSLSAYDAAYLEIALRYNVPLASFDKKLCAAAKKEGIEIL